MHLKISFFNYIKKYLQNVLQSITKEIKINWNLNLYYYWYYLLKIFLFYFQNYQFVLNQLNHFVLNLKKLIIKKNTIIV